MICLLIDADSIPAGSERYPGGGNKNPLQSLDWKIPWGLQFMGSQRVRHNWACMCAWKQTRYKMDAKGWLRFESSELLMVIRNYLGLKSFSKTLKKSSYIYQATCSICKIFSKKNRKRKKWSMLLAPGRENKGIKIFKFMHGSWFLYITTCISLNLIIFSL